MAKDTIESTFDEIRSMKVRGAGRIARAAVSALKGYCEGGRFSSTRGFYDGLFAAGEKLKEARPTAVSLPNAVNYVLASARRRQSTGGTLKGSVRRDARGLRRVPCV